MLYLESGKFLMDEELDALVSVPPLMRSYVSIGMMIETYKKYSTQGYRLLSSGILLSGEGDGAPLS